MTEHTQRTTRRYHDSAQACVWVVAALFLLATGAYHADAQPAPPGATHPPIGSDLEHVTQSARDGDTIVLLAGEYLGPIVVRQGRVTILGDPQGGTTVLGPAKARSAIVQVADGGELVLRDVQFKFNAKDQVGVYVSAARADLTDCTFASPTGYACYAKSQAALSLTGCRFTDLQQTGIVASKGADVQLTGCVFQRCSQSAVHLQEAEGLSVHDCRFIDIKQNTIAASGVGTIDIQQSEFQNCEQDAIAMQSVGSVLVKDSVFRGCRSAIHVVEANGPVTVAGNMIYDVPTEGQGVMVDGGDSVSINDNTVVGGSTGVSVSGGGSSQVELARNRLVNTTKNGMYISRATLDGAAPARLSSNAVFTLTGDGLVVDGATHVTMDANTILSADASAVSIQDGARAELTGNLLGGLSASLNLFNTTESDTVLHGEWLLDPVSVGVGQPTPLDGGSRDTVLLLTRSGAHLHEASSAVLNQLASLQIDTRSALDEPIGSLRDAVRKAEEELAGFTATRLSFEDSLGRSIASPFEVYDGTSPTVGSITYWSGDLKDARGLLDSLQGRSTALGSHLMESASEEKRTQIDQAAPSGPVGNEVRRSIAKELNRLIEGPLLFDEARFTGIKLDDETLAMVERVSSLSQADLNSSRNARQLHLVNRLLIEGVYPYQLARSRAITEVVDPEGWAQLPPGKYCLVASSDPSQRQVVTLERGEKSEVSTVVERSVWVPARMRSDLPETWFLFSARPTDEMRRALMWIRRPDENWSSFALLRPGTSQDDLAEARRLALATLSQADDVHPGSALKHGAVEDYAMRILAVAGESEDRQAILDACQPVASTLSEKISWAGLIGEIEARLGRLENGTLTGLLTQPDHAWALAAAIQLHCHGLSDGDDLLRAQLRDSADLSSTIAPAFMLLDSSDQDTLDAMRVALDRVLEAQADDATSVPTSASIAPAMYLLAYGSLDDWRRVAEVKFGPSHLFYLSHLCRDPLSVAKVLIPHAGGLNRNGSLELGLGFLDRPGDEADALYVRLLRAVAAHSASRRRRSGNHLGRPFQNSLNTSNLFCSFFMPNQTAVRFYGRFGRVTPFEPELDDRGQMPNLFAQTPWFVETRFLERYTDWWSRGIRSFEQQLDYVDHGQIAQSVEARGGDKPHAYDLFMAAHRISTRAYTNQHDHYPMGLQRRAYVLRHHGDSNGGISGVAEMFYDRSGDLIDIKLRLRQAALYHATSFIDVSSPEQYEHHRYMIDGGRALIDSINLHRPGQTVSVPITETQPDDEGFLVFKAALPNADPAGWYLDVNMRFMDQAFTLTYRLFSGESARRLHKANP